MSDDGADDRLFREFLAWRQAQRQPAAEAPEAPVIDGASEPEPEPPEAALLRLSITGRPEEREGWTNVVRDPTAGPCTLSSLGYADGLDDGAVEAIEAKEVFQQLEAGQRLAFMDEAWRVLKIGGQMTIIVPGRGANRCYMDPFNQWPPVVEDFFYLVNREWREANRYSHYPVKANFHWSYGFVLDDEISPRNEEAQRHAIKFYRNAAHSLIVTLTKLE